MNFWIKKEICGISSLRDCWLLEKDYVAGNWLVEKKIRCYCRQIEARLNFPGETEHCCVTIMQKGISYKWENHCMFFKLNCTHSVPAVKLLTNHRCLQLKLWIYGTLTWHSLYVLVFMICALHTRNLTLPWSFYKKLFRQSCISLATRLQAFFNVLNALTKQNA
jgi:hypothetical protein